MAVNSSHLSVCLPFISVSLRFDRVDGKKQQQQQQQQQQQNMRKQSVVIPFFWCKLKPSKDVHSKI